jgi:hypothetical protein
MPVILSQQVTGGHPSAPLPSSSVPRLPGVFALSLCALWAACTAWIACGTLGFTSANGGRIGLLPASPGAIVFVLAASAGVLALLRAGAPRLPLVLLALVVLPWLPVEVPAAFLIWSGPIAAAVWIAVGVMMVLGSNLDLSVVAERTLQNRLRPPLTAGLLAALIFTAAAWRAAPSVPGGDEPHYLVIVQSLLLDGDLKIENNHRRGDYRAFRAGELPPHFQRRGRNGEIYSIHAPGLPALVLPAFALAGYHGVVAFLILLSAAGSALAWRVAWEATRRHDAAWFAWAAVTLPVTTVFHSFSVFPDGPGGVLALTGVWALLRAEEERSSGGERVAPWFWHGVALAMLPWLHTRFALIAGAFGALILLRLSTTRNPVSKAVAFLSVPASSAMLWIGFFIVVYGTADPSAPYGRSELGSLVWVPGGLAGLLFDQRFGLLPYAPVLVFAFAGLAVMIRRPGSRRFAFELVFVMVPYLLTVTHFPMWWAGWSAPARFFAPLLGMLAAPAAVFWVAVAHRRERAVPLAALVFTVLATAALVSVDRGRLAFNMRDTPALWLEWLSRGADLPQALPWWTRGRDALFFRDVATWIASVLGAVLIVGAAGAKPLLRSSAALHVALAATLAVAVMTASTIVWSLRGTNGRDVASAQLRLLKALASTARVVAIDLDNLQPIGRATVPRRLQIEFTRTVSTGRAARREDGPLFEVPRVPAGEYRLTPRAATPRGWLMVGIGRDQFALRTAPIPSPPQPIDLRVPVTVRGFVVRGDEDARQSVSGLVVQPVAVARSGDWDGLVGRSAVRYGHATVFFLDGDNFPEPDGFWIRGDGTSSIVMQSDDARVTLPMTMRNGPAITAVTMDVAGARTELKLEPGEERRVAVPLDSSRRAALVTMSVAGGFRPSDTDPNSQDHRFLGIWVKLD